ncbi:MAG: hypothetical protein F6J86_44645 [Symploca sp. SIO1B1]|nr:hypothetical protein [Symploca sp. SIO1B1]
MNNNESSAYGWSKEGKRYHDTRPGKRSERLSIIGALCDNQFLAQAGISGILYSEGY